MPGESISSQPRTALILAGGKSSRMGQDKACLPFGKATLLEFLVERLRKVCGQIFMVTRPQQSYAHLKLPVLLDVMPDKFSLGGLYSGLLQSPAEVNFVCACDMPLIAPRLVNFLFEQLADHDAAVPQIGQQLEPLCAVYAKICLPAIHARLLANDLRMSGWLADVRSRFISTEEIETFDPHLHSFLNINTPADYQRLLALCRMEFIG